MKSQQIKPDTASAMFGALTTVDMFLDHLANSWEVCGHTRAMMDSVKSALRQARSEGISLPTTTGANQ